MLLSYNDLIELVKSGAIDAPLEHVNGTSIDVRLGDIILIEADPDPDPHSSAPPHVDLSDKQALRLPAFREVKLPEAGWLVPPGACVLASTVESFRLPPDVSCEFKLKSSVARCFLDHCLAGWCDPYWGLEVPDKTRLTLELVNKLSYHWFKLTPGMPIGQMVFFRSKPVPRERGYAARGRYNGTANVAVSQGVAVRLSQKE